MKTQNKTKEKMKAMSETTANKQKQKNGKTTLGSLDLSDPKGKRFVNLKGKNPRIPLHLNQRQPHRPSGAHGATII